MHQCVDITFALPEDVAEVNSSNCFNSTTFSFNDVFTIAQSATSSATPTLGSVTILALTAGLFWAFVL